MARYLVTGGAGFIGSHLCDALLGRGETVRVLDDLSSGSRGNLPPQVELQIGDVADPEAMRRAVQDVDGCFHLAAIASVARGVTDWLGTHRTNLTGTIGLFDALQRAGLRVPVVYASSAAVYGDGPAGPAAEDTPTRPLSAYGADKLGCEMHARVASHVFGIPTVGLRFFNVYGTRQDPRSPYSGVISIFCDRLPRGAPVEIFGDGGQTRDFIHVGDVVAGLLAAMARGAPGSVALGAPGSIARGAPEAIAQGAPGAIARGAPEAIAQGAPQATVLNLCTGRPTSILALARLIAELTGSTAEIRHAAPRAGEIRHSVGSPVRAKQVLGLGEPRSLRDGLRDMLMPHRD